MKNIEYKAFMVAGIVAAESFTGHKSVHLHVEAPSAPDAGRPSQEVRAATTGGISGFASLAFVATGKLDSAPGHPA